MSNGGGRLTILRAPAERVWEWLERLGPLLAFFVVVEGGFRFSHFLFGETTDVFYLSWIERNLVEPGSFIGLMFLVVHWIRSFQESWKIVIFVVPAFFLLAILITLKGIEAQQRIRMIDKGMCVPLYKIDPFHTHGFDQYCPGDQLLTPQTRAGAGAAARVLNTHRYRCGLARATILAKASWVWLSRTSPVGHLVMALTQ